MRSFGFLLALLMGMFATAPAAGQNATSAPAILTDETASHAQQLRRYGEWLQELQTAFQVSQAGMEPVSAAMQAAMANPHSQQAIAKARTVIAQGREAVAKARILLERLDAPELPGLGLSPELSTAAVRRGAIDINETRSAMMEELSRGIVALEKRDARAFDLVNAKMLAMGKQQVEVLALLVDARAAAVQAKPIDRTYFQLMALIYRSHARIRQPATTAGIRRDPALPAALEALAAKADAIVARGREENEANIAQSDTLAASAPAEQAEAHATLKRIRVAARKLFERGTQFATELRAIAAELRKAPLTEQSFIAIGERLVVAEKELAGIQMDLSMIGAGAPSA